MRVFCGGSILNQIAKRVTGICKFARGVSFESQEMEVPSRLLYIACDLLAQRLYGRKLDLIAHPLEEADFDFALRRQFNGVKVQQVGLDRKRLRTEGRTIAHVRDGIKALVAYARPGDVYPVLRHKFFITREIDGRYRVFGA